MLADAGSFALGGHFVFGNPLDEVAAGRLARHDRRLTAIAAGQRGFQIAFQHGGKKFLVFPFRMLRREDFDAFKGKVVLEIHRLLGPQCTIVVESSDAFLNRHETR